MTPATVTPGRGLLCEPVTEAELRAGDVFLAESDREAIPAMIAMWAKRESLLVHVWTGARRGSEYRRVLRLRIG